MVEPALVCGLCVTLTGKPEPAVLATVHTVALGSIVTVLGRPVCLACPAGLVTYPTCLATYTPHYAVGANLVNAVTQVRNIVVCGTVHIHRRVTATIVTATAVGTVEPHLELVGTILGKLGTLTEEHILHILVGTIVNTVAVPRRHIETVLEAQLLCSCCKITWDVCVTAILVTGVSDIVVSSLCRPLAETVVVLYHCNTATHTCCLCSLKPLTGVRRRSRSKTLGVLVAVTPLQTCISIHTIVEESIELCLLPL